MRILDNLIKKKRRVKGSNLKYRKYDLKTCVSKLLTCNRILFLENGIDAFNFFERELGDSVSKKSKKIKKLNEPRHSLQEQIDEEFNVFDRELGDIISKKIKKSKN